MENLSQKNFRLIAKHGNINGYKSMLKDKLLIIIIIITATIIMIMIKIIIIMIIGKTEESF